jgi:hypothetical protein
VCQANKYVCTPLRGHMKPKLFKQNNTWYCKLGQTQGQGQSPKRAYTNFYTLYNKCKVVISDDLIHFYKQ